MPLYQPPASVAGNVVSTWSELQALSGVAAGVVYRVSSAVISGGAAGTAWVWTGALWAPAARQVLIVSPVTIASAGPSTTETILRQVQIPANCLRGCSYVHGYARFSASGAADASSRTVRLRLGAAGTTSDTAVGEGFPLSSARNGQVSSTITPTSGSVMRSAIPVIGGSTPWEATSSSTTVQSSDLSIDSTVALWLSATVKQGASPVDTLSLEYFALEVA